MKHKNFIHEELYLYSRKQLLLLFKNIIHYVNWLCEILGMSLIRLFSFRHILFDFSFKQMQWIIIIIDMYESWNKFDCIVMYIICIVIKVKLLIYIDISPCISLV